MPQSGGFFPKIPVASPEPYPVPRVEEENPAYVRLLLTDYSSNRGEITAIFSYLYQSWTLSPEYEDLAAHLLRIAEVEMHHLQILGKLIVLLGGDPKCFAPIYRPNGSAPPRPSGSVRVPAGYFPWNGAMVRYTRDVQKLISENLVGELASIESYTQHAQIIQDERVSGMLLRIIEDEAVHKGIFESYLIRLSG